MKLKTCAVVCVSFLVLASQLSAFDGQRKGFILGGGIGGGSLKWSEPGLDFNQGAFATNFIIGYAPSNSLEIYYTNNVSWFSYQSESFVVGMSGIGLSKYLNKEGKGVFILGGIGVGVFSQMTGYTYSESGFGVVGGVGYDVAKHWRIQGEVLYTDIKSATSWAFRATINVIAF
jgi:opacity protein-like surface antigen